MGSIKYAVGLWCIGGMGDRFKLDGYSKFLSPKEKIKAAAKIEKVEAIELFWPSDLGDLDLKEFKKIVDGEGLKISCVSGQTTSYWKWKHGCFTATDDKLRQEEIDLGKSTLDVAAELSSKSAGFG